MTSFKRTKETQSGISPISEIALHPLGQCWANATTLLVGGSKHIITIVLAKSSVGVLYLRFSLLRIGFLTCCSVHSCAAIALHTFQYREDYFMLVIHWDSCESRNSSARHLVKTTFQCDLLSRAQPVWAGCSREPGQPHIRDLGQNDPCLSWFSWQPFS